jgi:hypothetical protein
MIKIEYKDSSGNWRFYSICTNSSSYSITHAMKECKTMYPNSPVRAIQDSTGMLVDMIS